MWKKKNSINNKILRYFLIFSIFILAFLCVFQSIFFKTFYKNQKLSDIKVVASKVKKNQYSLDYQNIINDIAIDHSVCIEIDDNNLDIIHVSKFFGKGCLPNKELTESFKTDFINGNKKENTYEITNTRYNNETIVYAIRLSDNRYAFINASIEPVDSTVILITKQLIVMTILILILSFILAYYISNHISNPIKKLNEQAKILAKGNTNLTFDNDSGILEISELIDTLNYAKDELSKTEELRRDLMANVSHDLKTPLTMIKAYAEMSIDLHSDNKDKQKEDINTIISESDRLTLLVNDILTLSKMQTNIEELELSEFNLIELTDTILKRYSLYKETENYKFIFNHNIDKIIIEADKKKIEQVIYNLVNNAINYTGEDNTVTVNINKNNNNIKVEIIDTGKGIKKEEIDHIWDRYYKSNKKHKRNILGTGLGLSIVKNILESHNYEYGVKTKENKGSNFYFIIKQKKK